MSAPESRGAAVLTAPPKNNLVRLLVPGDGIGPGLELREATGAKGTGAAPVMFGEFAVYNRWTEIDSFFEGRFLERFVNGSFKRTFVDDADRIRSIFQHGRDPQIGMKPLGPIDTLREQDSGAYYEVPLLDAPYARETLLPGLRANLYGASFKFRVMREEIVDNPGISDHNPQGIPERTVKEARLYEFGPVTFPAYADASAGVRSGTDDYFLEGLAQADPECVRAAAEFSRDHAPFSVFIADYLGVSLPERNGNDANGNSGDADPDAPTEADGAAEPEVTDEREQEMAEAVKTLIERGLTPEQVLSITETEPTADLDSTNVGDGDERDEKADVAAPEQDESATTPPAAQDPAVRGTTPLLGRTKEPWRL